MIRRIAPLVIVFVLCLSAPALAVEPGSGVIEGQVINGTGDGSSVADQDVNLKTYLNEAEVGTNTSKTDAEGWFAFNGLSTEPGYSYQVAVTFQDAEYTSAWLIFDEGETTKSTEVIVYDATTSDETIKVTMTHTVIYAEEGAFRVNEFFLFSNEADRTYIGSKEIDTEGTRETLRFSLPKEATDLQAEYGLMECCIYGSENGFVDTMPVLPGDKEVVYSYRINYNSGEYIFSRNVNYPTSRYDLLFQSAVIEAIDNQLAVEEPMDIEGTQFEHLSGSDFAPGGTLAVRLSGLPETNNQSTLTWVVLTLVGLVGGFSLTYLLRKRKLQPVITEDSLDQKRQRLLFELARLDDDFESGKITEDGYHKLRAERKAQLVELTQRSKEETATDNGET